MTISGIGSGTIPNVSPYAGNGISVPGPIHTDAYVTGASVTAQALVETSHILRLVLHATTGPPATGFYFSGSVYGDSVGDLWVCTVTGSPGTWRQLLFA